MKAITLTQPWATLVAIGAKKIETRSWRTNYRGPLAIHAGKGLGAFSEADIVALMRSSPFFEALTAAGFGEIYKLPRASIVCITNIENCVPTTEMNKFPVSPELDFGDYNPGRYAWYLGPVKRLENSIPAKGAQMLWEWQEPL